LSLANPPPRIEFGKYLPVIEDPKFFTRKYATMAVNKTLSLNRYTNGIVIVPFTEKRSFRHIGVNYF
jgi:hypothetical protein